MNESPVGKLSIVFVCTLSIVVLSVNMYSYFFSETSVTFCDVGQGDGAYIRTSDGFDVLIDAGPSGYILSCIGEHMPIFDRTIELAVLTHPHLDHYGGFIETAKRYTIKTFLYPGISSEDEMYQELLKILEDKGTKMISVYSADVIDIGTAAQIKVLWPNYQYVSQNASISEDGVLLADGDPNDHSVVLLFSQFEMDILFTGDISPSIHDVLENHTIIQNGNIEILKVAHHGSKNGLTKAFLTTVNPLISIISVGTYNKFGHPSPEILDMFTDEKRTVALTSRTGSITFEISKKGWRTTTDIFSK